MNHSGISSKISTSLNMIQAFPHYDVTSQLQSKELGSSAMKKSLIYKRNRILKKKIPRNRTNDRWGTLHLYPIEKQRGGGLKNVDQVIEEL